MKCSGGHHRWKVNPPSLGTPCINCERTWTPPGFRRKSAVGPTPPPGPAGIAPQPPAVVSLPVSDRAERLASALAQLASRSSAPAAPPAADMAPAPPPPAPGPSRFAQHMGQRLARMFDAATDAAIERFKRTPGEVDETDLDDFADAAAEIITRWMPDAELGPYGKLAMSAVFVVGGKWVGGEPIPRLAAAPVAAMSTTAPTTPPSTPASSEASPPAAAAFAGGL